MGFRVSLGVLEKMIYFPLFYDVPSCADVSTSDLQRRSSKTCTWRSACGAVSLLFSADCEVIFVTLPCLEYCKTVRKNVWCTENERPVFCHSEHFSPLTAVEVRAETLSVRLHAAFWLCSVLMKLVCLSTYVNETV